MLEQEVASIIKCILEASENPAPYYYEVPEEFTVPAVYFPAIEVPTRGETLSTYAMDCTWFIKFMHNTTQEALAIAFKALTAIKEKRNLIPLIDTDGKRTGKTLRIKDPSLDIIDRGAVQLQIDWTSNRPYNTNRAEKAANIQINLIVN